MIDHFWLLNAEQNEACVTGKARLKKMTFNFWGVDACSAVVLKLSYEQFYLGYAAQKCLELNYIRPVRFKKSPFGLLWSLFQGLQFFVLEYSYSGGSDLFQLLKC
jgi:hypothetical protein